MRARKSRSSGLKVGLLFSAMALAMACGKSDETAWKDAGALSAGGSVGSSGSGGTVGSGGSTGTAGSGCVPDYACAPTAPNTGDVYADCVTRMNQFRACVCLPPLARWTSGEACADQDAQYDSQQNVAHAGFQAGICASGNAQDECPGWKNATQVISQCLAQMFAEGPPPTTPCTGSCYSAHGHYINMTGTKYSSGVACGFYTTPTGSLWAAQNFK
jgi:hypothetical protein